MVEFVQNRLYLRPSKYFDNKSLPDRSCVSLQQYNGVLTVSDGHESGTAMKAGLQVTDIITHVNGTESHLVERHVIRELLSQEEKNICLIAVRNDEQAQVQFLPKTFREFEPASSLSQPAKILAEAELR